MANTAYNVVRDFENEIAQWSGSKYAVAVESCTAAIFLSLMYRGVKGEYITIPKHTYPSVPCSIIQAGGFVEFSDEPWSGVYELKPTGVIDGALRFRRGMYNGGLHCLSFHLKKNLPIGRGGMILTDDLVAVEWLRMARFDGRREEPLEEMTDPIIGWNAYMMPEQAARGLQLFSMVKNRELPDLDAGAQGYPDLSKFPIYTQ